MEIILKKASMTTSTLPKFAWKDLRKTTSIPATTVGGADRDVGGYRYTGLLGG
jgi:hypothetical protein